MSRTVKIRQPRWQKKKKPVVMTFDEFESTRCSHCGGAHLRACPRIKRMVFHTSGTLNEIEFWADGEWDTSNVLWPESIIDPGETNE